MSNPIDLGTMSDEDFLNMDEAEFEVPEEVSEDNTEEEVTEEQEEEKGDTEVVDEDTSGSEEEDTEEGESKDESTEDEEEESTEEKSEDKPDEDKKEEPDAVKAEDFFKEITKPFKANGVMHEITDPSDVVRLMKMGLNYSKKMTVMKPHLKVTKMLERHNLLDEDKISYLIDLDKKDPNAISKLVKDSGVDQYEITNNDNEYSPKSYALSDEEVQLEDVIADVKESDEGSRTLNIIGQEWDDESKQMLANEPQYIKALNDQVINGQYDQIAAQVAKERALGKLVGLSDIKAYDSVGKQLAQAGTLVGIEPPKEIVKPKASKPKTDNSSRKKAASIGSKRIVKKTPEKDPMQGKDDDFLKEFNSLVL